MLSIHVDFDVLHLWNKCQWNIGWVGYQTQNLRVGHVHFMLFVSISFALGSQRKCTFQWNMSFRINQGLSKKESQITIQKNSLDELVSLVNDKSYKSRQTGVSACKHSYFTKRTSFFSWTFAGLLFVKLQTPDVSDKYLLPNTFPQWIGFILRTDHNYPCFNLVSRAFFHGHVFMEMPLKKNRLKLYSCRVYNFKTNTLLCSDKLRKVEWESY